MTVEKIYRSLTKGEIGVYVGTSVDETDGKICHILNITHEDGSVEERHIADSTFKRWWKLVEETTAEDLQESVEQLNQIKHVVTKEQPTIEDLKQLNESGEELTEEELQLFRQQSQEHVEKEVEVVEAVLELQQTDTTEEKPKKKPVLNKEDAHQMLMFVRETVEEIGGEITLYSEHREGVIKFKGKAEIFFGKVKNGLRLYFKEQIDEIVLNGYNIEEKHSYPKQFPFRVLIPQLDDKSKEILSNIISFYK